MQVSVTHQHSTKPLQSIQPWPEFAELGRGSMFPIHRPIMKRNYGLQLSIDIIVDRKTGCSGRHILVGEKGDILVKTPLPNVCGVTWRPDVF